MFAVCRPSIQATATGDIAVVIKTGPVDAEDDSYMCDNEGMLQWHAQIKYGAKAAAEANTTPAVMAAQANDYVAYSGDDFKSLLAAYLNDEVGIITSLLFSSRDFGL